MDVTYHPKETKFVDGRKVSVLRPSLLKMSNSHTRNTYHDAI